MASPLRYFSTGLSKLRLTLVAAGRPYCTDSDTDPVIHTLSKRYFVWASGYTPPKVWNSGLIRCNDSAAAKGCVTYEVNPRLNVT
jgi:hypothetical protein